MKKYAIISNKKRNELITRVVQNAESVSRVAKQLRMKLPSAKSIIRTYKKQGKIFDKKKIINRNIKCKRVDLSETQNMFSPQASKEIVNEYQSCEQKQEKRQQKPDYKTVELQNKITFENPSNLEEMMSQYYSQLYMAQQCAYYYNLLQYAQNINFLPTQI